MKIEGKVMSATRRDLGAITLAGGGCPSDYDDDRWLPGHWTLGVVWLGMTAETAYRWRNGRDYPNVADVGYPDIEAERLAERERWYA
jgi:hypothetical protein